MNIPLQLVWYSRFARLNPQMRLSRACQTIAVVDVRSHLCVLLQLTGITSTSPLSCSSPLIYLRGDPVVDADVQPSSMRSILIFMQTTPTINSNIIDHAHNNIMSFFSYGFPHEGLFWNIFCSPSAISGGSSILGDFLEF